MNNIMQLIKTQVKNGWSTSLLISVLMCSMSSCNSGSSNSEQSAPPTITSFSINGVPGTITSYANNGVPTDYNITVQLAESTVLSDLVPVFSLSANATNVTVNGITNYSAASHNDFTRPLIYTVNGSIPNKSTTYTVAVNYGVLTTNITESTYYSITTGLSTEITVSVTGAYAANGKTLTTQQVYIYGNELFIGPSVQKIIQLGNARDNPPQAPIGQPAKNVAIAALLLFLPSYVNVGCLTAPCPIPSISDYYYYPTLEYKIPIQQ